MAASSTSIYGFSFKESLNGQEHPSTRDFILDDSATFTIGDSVRLDTDGLLVVNGTGDTVFGILAGIVDQNGMNVFVPEATGTTGATLTPDDTVTTSSTNSSDATRKLKGQVIVDPAGTNLYRNDTDEDLTQSDIGAGFDLLSSGDRIDASTATTSGQFQCVAIDADDASVGYFRIAEGQY